MNKYIGLVVAVLLLIGGICASSGCTSTNLEETYQSGQTNSQNTYVIVDTGQNTCYDNAEEIAYPDAGEPFYGQDAQYYGTQQSYQDNGDGTITDLNTGLIWQQSFDHNEDGKIDYADKLSYVEILAMVAEGVIQHE